MIISIVKKHISEAKNILIFSGLGGLSQVLGAILPLLVAKIFEPAMFANFTLGRMIIFLFLSVSISAFQRPVIVIAAREKEQTGHMNKTFTAYFFVVISSFLCVSFLSGLFRVPIAKFIGINSNQLTPIFLAFVGYMISSMFSTLFLAMGYRIKSAICDFIFNLLTFLGVILLLVSGKIDFSSVFIVYFFSAIVLFCLFVWFIDYKAILPVNFEISYVKEIFHFMKWVLLGIVSVYLINWGDNLVLRLFVNLDKIGIYNLAYQISKSIMFLTSTIYFYFLPFLGQDTEKLRRRTFLKVKRPKLIIFFSIGLVAVLFSVSWLIEYVYGATYLESIQILRILIIANFIITYTVFFRCLFDSMGRYKFFNIATAIQIVINLILNFVFVPFFGIYGAAIATVIGYVFLAVLMEFYYRKTIMKEVFND